MKRPDSTRRLPRRGFTLIELLVATSLTLVMMGAVAQIFVMVNEGVSSSRATLEMSARLRNTAATLQRDLGGHTAVPIPSLDPATDQGYLEIIEGAFNGTTVTIPQPVDSSTGNPDTTVGDCDDILLLTTRSPDAAFVGRFNNGTIRSQVAEVAWYLRGRKLYRRVLLVRPDAFGSLANSDISVRSGPTANTLGDLTKRENRFLHTAGYPHSVANIWQSLPSPRDYWRDDDPPAGPGFRDGEDVILTNVITFDIKVWDPGAPVVAGPGGVALMPGDPGYNTNLTHLSYGAFVDLGYAPGYAPGAGVPQPLFHRFNYDSMGLSSGLTRVYDTWSTHYNKQNGIGSNGIDDNGDGVVDDIGESSNQAPYPAPLRGIQIKIRVFDPDSRQIREVTVKQDFLIQ